MGNTSNRGCYNNLVVFVLTYCCSSERKFGQYFLKVKSRQTNARAVVLEGVVSNKTIILKTQFG